VNATHANVLSVPTIRVEEGIAARWPEAATDGAAVPGLETVVKLLMIQKLGMADVFEQKQAAIALERFGAWQGESFIDVDDRGCDVLEDLTMFNAQVFLRDGDHAVPAATLSYEPIVWTPVESFLSAVVTRDVSCIDPTLDQILICVRGLCVESTRHLLTDG
jgi:hypothetical protein